MKFHDIIQAILLAVGLAMDAASASMTNGMIERNMKLNKMLLIAFLFCFFQGVMPLIGYFVGSIFTDSISVYLGYIGFALLAFLGIKMIVGAIKDDKEEGVSKITLPLLFLQAIATSIDALATGVIYIDKKPYFAIIVFLIVSIVTFIISLLAIALGKKFGELLNKYAEVFGGIILLSIGFKLLLNDLFYIYLLFLSIVLIVCVIVFYRSYKKKSVKFNTLLKEIEMFVPIDEHENNDKNIIIKLLKEKKFKSFSRTNEDIHMTCSAIVLNQNKDKVLFCYHNIYNSWSWLGGHADNDIDLIHVATKEIKEETGLEEFVLLSDGIISLEILDVKEHIKNGKLIKKHRHANVTYVFLADENSIITHNSNENSAVKFLEIELLDKYVNEVHMLPIYHKILNRLNNKKSLVNN